MRPFDHGPSHPTTSHPVNRNNMPSARTILATALFVGTLDLSAALIQYYSRTGKDPFRPVLCFVASGLLGKSAYRSGDIVLLAGLLIHYCVAATFTALFFLLVAQQPFARQHRLLTGILYGALVWMIMNLVVLPLSAAQPLPKTVSSVAIGMGILILCIGLPLALVANQKPARKYAVARQ